MGFINNAARKFGYFIGRLNAGFLLDARENFEKGRTQGEQTKKVSADERDFTYLRKALTELNRANKV